MNPFRKDDWAQLGKRFWWQILLSQALILFVAGLIVSRVYFPITVAGNPGQQMSDSDHESHNHASAADTENAEPEWWTCAMHPQIRQKKPGNCPICQMELVPVQPSSGGLRTLTIKPSVKKLMKVETAPVERRYVTADVRMVGKVEYDETRLAHITAWVSGRLDRLYVDYAGVRVNEGDHMVYIYSEELYSIQEELIQAIKFQRDNPRTGGLDLAEAAREKLRLLGLTDEQIKKIEQQENPQSHVTIYAPRSGIVIDKLKQEGDRVKTGDRIYTVADLNQVWVKLDAYESDLAWIRYGQTVSFTTEAYPGETFSGRIAFIDPVLNKDTRTVKVRVNVSNQDGRLKPEMFVRAVVDSNVAAGGRVLDSELAGKWISPMHPEIVKDQPGTCDICGMPLVRAETLGYVPAETDPAAKPLVIPASAALVTGTRAIVYVEVPGTKEPTYEGREVLLGPRAGDFYLVRNGLFDGELVVTHGNFKIDSALQIQAKPTMMTPEGGGGGGGHNHGGGDMKQTAGSMDAAMEMDLPARFKEQLNSLVGAAQRVSELIETEQLDSIRTAFSDFYEALNRVNAEGLAEHPAMLWRESLMLLGNDAIEGKDAVDLAMASRVEASLRDHIRRMRNQFMLIGGNKDHDSAAKTQALVAGEPFRSQLGNFALAYFQLQQSLAADQWNPGGSEMKAVLDSLAAIDGNLLEGEAAELWAKEGQQLSNISDRLRQAEGIAQARSELALLSEQLLVILKRFGASGIEPYELHCPMAFEGRGATWLQNNDKPANPYFGASMLTCADKVRKIDLPAETDGNDGGHRNE